MQNPFESIESRLSNIESLILDLKHQPKEVEPTEQKAELLTIDEAAIFLSLSKATLYSKVSKRELPFMKKSKRLYFSRTELMDYLKEGSKKTKTELETEAIENLTSTKKQ